MAQFIESDQGMINLAYVVRVEKPVNGYARVHLAPHAGKAGGTVRVEYRNNSGMKEVPASQLDRVLAPVIDTDPPVVAAAPGMRAALIESFEEPRGEFKTVAHLHPLVAWRLHSHWREPLLAGELSPTHNNPLGLGHRYFSVFVEVPGGGWCDTAPDAEPTVETLEEAIELVRVKHQMVWRARRPKNSDLVTRMRVVDTVATAPDHEDPPISDQAAPEGAD